MRPGRTLILTGFALCVALTLGPASLTAQQFDLDFQEAELVAALDVYAKQAGVSVVYADRVVRGRTVSCTYEGTDPTAALDCLIGERLQASWLRDDQVVLATKLVEPKVSIFRGIVIDSDTGSPLPGAHVSLPGLGQGMVADESGRFAIKTSAPSDLNVLISYLGYESREVVLATPDRLNPIVLKSLMIEGEAIVVEGERSGEANDGVGAAQTMSGLVADFAGGLGSADMLQSVASHPGIGRTGEVSGGLVIRGGLPDQSVFLIDGAPVYQPWHSQGLFSVLQPSAMDDVVLFSGPLPADQAGQLGAVLDASVSAGSPQDVSTSASVTSSLAEVAVKAPLARGFTGMLAARRSHAGLSRTHAQSLPNSQPLEGGSFYDVAAKVGIRPSPANMLSFTLYRGGDRLEWADDPTSRVNNPRVGSWQNAVYTFRHRYIASNRVLVTNSIYASTFDATSELSSEGLLALTTDDEYQEVRDMGLRINVDYLASARHAINLGVQFAQHHIEWSEVPVPLLDGPPVRTTFRDEVIETAVYVQDTWDVNERLTVRPGLRVSWFGNTIGQSFEPRFHSRYLLTSNSHLRLAWSRQTQYLHQVHNIVNGGLGSTITKWIVSSGPMIAPSTGDQLVVGLTSRRSAYWTVSADLYWRQLENVFLPSEPVIPIPSAHRSLFDAPPERFEDYVQGRSRSYGVELQATYNRDWFRFWTSYTGARSLIQLPTDPDDSGFRSGVYDTPHVVRASTGFEGSRWEFALTGEARTGYPTLASVKGGDDTPSRFPTYFRLDAAVGYHFYGLGARWDLQGRVYNLTDRENVVGYEYDDNILNLRRNSLLGVTRWPTFRLEVGW